MSTTITGKLNQSAREFPAGNSIGFGVQLGVRYYDRDTKQSEYTNYETAVFTNNDNQANFYRQSLVEGAVIEVTAAQERIKSFEGKNGTQLSIELLDAKLGYVFSGSQSGNPAPQQQQGGGQTPQNNSAPEFDDDIPF